MMFYKRIPYFRVETTEAHQTFIQFFIPRDFNEAAKLEQKWAPLVLEMSSE